MEKIHYKGHNCSIDQYIQEKVALFKELCIPLTPNDIDYLYNLNTEIAIDNYCHKLIIDRL